MDFKDTFLTFRYDLGYIHTCENRTTGKMEVKSQIDGEVKKHKTILGAKRYISKELARRKALSDACMEKLAREQKE